MAIPDIPPDKAELLSIVLESTLYGFSLLMFGGTIWALFSQRSTGQVNHKMLAVACALLICSTAHLVIHVVRVMDGLVRYRDTFAGGPIAYFLDVSQWTFVTKSHLYTLQTLIGDGVMLYRCYTVWQSKLVMIVPLLLWCSVGVTGIGTVYTVSLAHNGIFGVKLSRWITSWWATALATNLLTTLLLAYRIWYVDRKTASARGNRQSRLQPLLHTIIDAGVIYSVTVIVALICFECHTYGQFVILDMVMPIISIAFYMVIIRVGLANRTTRQTSIPVRYASVDNTQNTDRRRTVQIHVTKLTESRADECAPMPMYVGSPPDSEEISRSLGEVKLDGGRGDVPLGTLPV